MSDENQSLQTGSTNTTGPLQPYQQVPLQQQVPSVPLDQQQQVPPSVPISGGGISPEIPINAGLKKESGSENVLNPEQVIEKKESTKNEPLRKNDSIKVPDVTPDQKNFEQPSFSLSGYAVSSKIVNKSRKMIQSGVHGDTSFAKMWLIILLGRLLQMPQKNLSRTL
jgi:hypothetical protein